MDMTIIPFLAYNLSTKFPSRPIRRNGTGDHKGQCHSNKKVSIEPPRRATTRVPAQLHTTPAPTIRRIGSPRPYIVGAGEDVDVGMGPLWPPVHAHALYLKCIVPCGRPSGVHSHLPI